MRLNERVTKWSAVAVLSMGTAAPALGGSVTRPGDTIGFAVGAPLPPGFYVENTSTLACRNTSPEDTCVGVDVPILTWSTPWTIFGGRLQPSFAPLVPITIDGMADLDGVFNPFAAGQLAWDLGDGWGVSYMLGAYLPMESSVAYSSASLHQRVGLSYTADGWNLSANFIWGIQFDEVTNDPQVSPCPVSPAHPHNGCNPDFFNVDLTATKRFENWELGPVGLYSTDLNAPVPEYEKQSQFAVGGLVGYYFDRAAVQAIVTNNVYEKNYGGSEMTASLRFTIALGNP